MRAEHTRAWGFIPCEFTWNLKKGGSENRRSTFLLLDVDLVGFHVEFWRVNQQEQRLYQSNRHGARFWENQLLTESFTNSIWRVRVAKWS